MRKIFINKKRKDNIKIKYHILQIEFIILFIILAMVIFFNYDYMLFKILICGNYIYTDSLDYIYLKELKTDSESNYYKNFDKAVISVFTAKLREESKDRYTFLYLPEELSSSKKAIKETALKSSIEVINDNTAYMYISNFSKYSREIIFNNIDLLENKNYLIIDLRGNPGGSLNDCYKISDLFIPKNMIISYETARNKLFSKEIKSKKAQKLIYKDIYILQNENTASAAEVLINALKQNLDNITIIGSTSFGKGIGQAQFDLKNKYAVQATVLKIQTPDKSSIHKIGIKPDIEYKNDDILEYTLSKINKEKS